MISRLAEGTPFQTRRKRAFCCQTMLFPSPIVDLVAPSSAGFKFLPYDAQGSAPAPFPPDTSSPHEQLTLNHSSSWTYCGPLLPLAQERLPPSFHIWASTTINGSLPPSLFPLLSFVNDHLTRAKIPQYWITIRATKANSDFDQPRWHTDDDFFTRNLLYPTDNHADSDNYNTTFSSSTTSTNSTKRRRVWKLIATLLGPGTLLLPDGSSARSIQRRVKREARDARPPHTCVSIRCLGCAATADDVRARLATELKDHRVIQAEAGQCVLLRLGESRGAVHSEPPCDRDRIFVNVVPGTEAELRGLMSAWGMEYPRAWSMGLPLFP